jgi:hypothetical protein
MGLIHPEVGIGSMRRAGLFLTVGLAMASPAAAQAGSGARQDYLLAVAGFFSLPPNEVAILGDWDILADELPVVLFMARRAGVSPEALVALRGAGHGWSALATRYRVTAAALHVPVRDDAPAGSLSGVYEKYRSTPVAEWGTISVSDRDIIGLVNVRVISQVLRLSAEQVLGRVGSTASFVELYAQLQH